jgi:hypothetical protein
LKKKKKREKEKHVGTREIKNPLRSIKGPAIFEVSVSAASVCISGNYSIIDKTPHKCSIILIKMAEIIVVSANECPHISDERLLSAALNTDEVNNPELRLNPPQRVTGEEYVNCCKAWHSEGSDMHCFLTPQEDMEEARKLLDLPALAPYWVKTRQLNCPDCGRVNNFLDVVSTATRSVHSADFLKKVFSNEFGCIVNSSPYQRCCCYECGVELPRDATKFLCPDDGYKTCSSESDTAAAAPYLYNVYTHKY